MIWATKTTTRYSVENNDDICDDADYDGADDDGKK